MIIFSLVAMTGLEKCCITSAYLQWQYHSGERPVARGPLVQLLGRGVEFRVNTVYVGSRNADQAVINICSGSSFCSNKASRPCRWLIMVYSSVHTGKVELFGFSLVTHRIALFISYQSSQFFVILLTSPNFLVF